MTKAEIEKAIKNGESAWVAHRNAVLELCPDMSVKISNSDMPDVAMTTFEVDNGGIVIKRKTQWTDLFFHYDDISKNKAAAEHYAFHKNVTRTETLPFLTWEEFKEIRQISFIGKDKKEYIFKKDIIWSNNKYTLVDCLKIVNETDFTFSKYFDYTEENFYKAYDEAVRLFREEE